MNKNKINNQHLLDSNLISEGLNKNKKEVSRNNLNYHKTTNDWTYQPSKANINE